MYKIVRSSLLYEKSFSRSKNPSTRGSESPGTNFP